MGGSLGEKLGEGWFAEVHVWAPGQVIKLFKPGIRRRVGRYEAILTQAVFAAGGPAPQVLDELMLGDRYGFVMPRYDGPTLAQQLRAEAVTTEAAGEVLAGLGLAVHRTPAPAEALSVAAYVEGSLQSYPDRLPPDLGAGVLALATRLAPDDRLSHCDLHPANVIMTADGPRLVDWTGAKRGGAAMDLACCRFLRTEIVPEILGDAAAQAALDEAVQDAYARLAGRPRAELQVAVEAQLPVVRALFLLGGMPRPETRERLLRRLEADLGRRPPTAPAAPR